MIALVIEVNRMESESESIEYKSAMTNTGDIAKPVCAFANTSGGSIFVGVADSGSVVGVPANKLDEWQIGLAEAVSCVSPMPDHRITLEDRDGKDIIRLVVSPMTSDSFCTFQGVVYLRSGSVNRKIEGQALLNFLVDRQILHFDQRMTDYGIEEIAPHKVEDYLKRRSPGMVFEESRLKEYLINLGLAKQEGSFRLRNAAILFFAKAPSGMITQAEIKLARYPGREPIDNLDKLFATGTILENLDAAQAFIVKNTRTGYKIEGMYRKDVPEYPNEVVRELLVNAIVHRDYYNCNGIQINIFSDRLEILNPGTLLPGLTLANLGSISIQRNPLIYRMLRDIGLVEGMATGIPMVRTVMMKGRRPFPQFEELGSFFKVTLFNEEAELLMGLNDRQKVALNHLRENGSITTGRYMELNQVSRPTAFNELMEMKRKGIVGAMGKGRTTRYEVRM